ncbi:protein kinase, partial [Candidatus Parcubacteria bacterium]
MALTRNGILDDKYEIVYEIKKGGFGIVYYGLDRRLNRPVAIKEIAPNLLDDPKYLDMFQEEALNIAKLSHNNIVHIYELKKTADGNLYIIMEYIDGTDLEKIIRRLRRQRRLIPPHLAVHIVAETCMALDYAHQRRDAFTNKPLNLVHQDISPSNIMI